MVLWGRVCEARESYRPRAAQLMDMIAKAKKESLPDWTKQDPRTMRQAKIAEDVAGGNMRVVREQVRTARARAQRDAHSAD